MKILNINKLKNEQNNITQKLLSEFADKNSIALIDQIKQTLDDGKALKQVIIQFEPIVNKIYAEVLAFKMHQMKEIIDMPSTNTREQVLALLLGIEEVLQEIEKQFQIPYHKKYIEEAFYEITIPDIVDNQVINNSDCWCKKCTIS